MKSHKAEILRNKELIMLISLSTVWIIKILRLLLVGTQTFQKYGRPNQRMLQGRRPSLTAKTNPDAATERKQDEEQQMKTENGD